MPKRIPSISECMTPMPYVIEAGLSVKHAVEKMRSLRIRHIPVRRQGILIGIFSELDTLRARGDEDLLIEDIATSNPYVVPPETKLDLVVSEMATGKYGSAIVQSENGQVVGILTVVDVCRILRDLLQSDSRLDGSDLQD